MNNTEWKRLVMGLMSLNDDKGRIEELQTLLNKIKETDRREVHKKAVQMFCDTPIQETNK